MQQQAYHIEHDSKVDLIIERECARLVFKTEELEIKMHKSKLVQLKMEIEKYNMRGI